MTTSTTVIGVPFSVEYATVLPGFATVRVRFTNDPKQSNPSLATDGLNPSNYTLTGPVLATVLSVSVVPDDPQSLDLALSVPLTTGSWILTVANVETAFADPLLSPTSASFTVVAGVNVESVNQGATNSSAESVLRANLSSAFTGRFWDAIIAALATGDKKNWDNARSIFDQLFLSSASGKYLDQRAADVGLSRPADVGFSDEQFRDLAIKITAGKLTAESIYEILEIFYGPEATRGSLTTDLYEPFSLVDGLTLDITVDEVDSVRIILAEEDFVQVGRAKAVEVAAAITRAFRNQNTKAWAQSFTDPETGNEKVRVYSPSLGLGSSVRVTGGSAQNYLRFPEILATNGTEAGVAVGENWTVTVPETEVMRFTISNSASVKISDVKAGDYVNIYGGGFSTSNRGSFTITKVDVRYVSGVLVQYFEVANTSATAEGPIAVLTASDIVFFRPRKGTNSGSRTVVVCQAASDLLNIILPATSPAVQRRALRAAYLQAQGALTANSLIRAPDGTTTLTFGSAHGLTAGQWIFVDGMKASQSPPPITPGNLTTTTNASVLSHWSEAVSLESLLGAGSYFMSAAIGNKVYVFGGVNDSFVPLAKACVLSIDSSSGDPAQYTFSTAALPTGGWGGVGGQMTAVSNTELLITGATIGTAEDNKSYKYDVANSLMSALPNMNLPRMGHRQSLLPDGRVFVSGGNTGGIAGRNEVFNPATGTWNSQDHTQIRRVEHCQVTLSDGNVFVVGGHDGSGSSVEASVAEIIYVDTGVSVKTSAMTYPRYSAASVLLPDGRVMIIGGQGYIYSPVTAEVWDPVTGRWSVIWRTAADLARYRVETQAHYIPTLQKVLVFGGYGVGAEFYDVPTGKWSKAPFTDSNIDLAASQTSAVMDNGIVLVAGGFSYLSSTSTSFCSLLIPGTLKYTSGELNGQLVQVATTPSPTTLTFQSSAKYVESDNEITVTRATAQPSSSGPYVYDPDSGVSVSDVETTTTQRLNKGQQYVSIPVADASQFPDENGWICLGFGTSLSQKLKYRGRFSATALAIDASYRFTETLNSGSTVTLLSGSGPYVPTAPQDVGSFYLTNSASGRVGAEQSVNSVKAAGVTISVEVVYPGDTGLGGAGLPTSNADKISDVVGVFAGNEEDAEIAAAKVGG